MISLNVYTEKVVFVATYATSGALASSRDALRADSDLRTYGHAIGGTAQQTLWSFYHSYRSRASALSVMTTGRQRSVGVWTSPPPQEPARLA